MVRENYDIETAQFIYKSKATDVCSAVKEPFRQVYGDNIQ